METITKKINFIKSCFGDNYKLSRGGKNIQVKCPICNPDTDKVKFSICLETWVCHCWVCGVKGKSPYYIIKNNISSKLASDFIDKFNITTKNAKKEDIVPKVQFPDKFRLLAQIRKTKDPDIRDILHYLKLRGLNKEDMWRHKIGYFTGNRWSRRVVFPSFDHDQELDYYVTRSIDREDSFKYLNCKADKTKIVFDEMRIDWSKEIIIVEGVFDMVKCPRNSVCLLGSGLNDNHALFKKIVENRTPVILALDSDMKNKTYKIARLLTSYNINVRLIDLGNYSDVGQMNKEIVKQKCIEAPTYSGEIYLLSMIDTITSSSMF